MERLTREIREEVELLSIPEMSDGFDGSLELKASGMTPVTYYEKVPSTGTYEVYIKVTAAKEVERLYLFAGKKHLVYLGGLKQGEVLEKTTMVHLSEVIPRYHETAYAQTYVTVTFACEEPEALQPLQISVKKTEETIPVLYLAGDSTVTDQVCEIPYNPGACYSSWGQNLSLYMNHGYVIDNQAQSGLTTESFRKGGYYDIVLSGLQPGDYCMVQFGHNDQKLPHLQPETGYRENLINYVKEIRDQGGIPILVTPLARNTWHEDGTYYDLLEEYAEEVLKIAAEFHVPVIDLHETAMAEIRSRGMEDSRCLFHPQDMTHSNEYGSVLFARMIARGLKGILPGGEQVIDDQAAEWFLPPVDLWEQLAAVSNNRRTTEEEKEQFDSMEKSFANLLKVVQAAKGTFGRKGE